MRFGLILMLTACSATPIVEPIAGPLVETVVSAGDCYAKAHVLDAGRKDAFDKCACEAGAGPEYCHAQ